MDMKLQNKMQIPAVARETHLGVYTRNNYNDNRHQRQSGLVLSAGKILAPQEPGYPE